MAEVKEAPKFIRLTPLSLRKQLEDDDSANLVWSVRNGYPRVTVFTSTKEFTYNKMVTAPFDYITLFTFINYLKLIATAPADTKYQVLCYNNTFVDNKRTDEVKLQATVTIGKDKDNIVYIAAIEEDKRKLKFELNFNKWHTFTKNGEPITDKSELSKIYTLSYVKTMERLFSEQLSRDGLIKAEKNKNSRDGNDKTRLTNNEISNIF